MKADTDYIIPEKWQPGQDLFRVPIQTIASYGHIWRFNDGEWFWLATQSADADRVVDYVRGPIAHHDGYNYSCHPVYDTGVLAQYDRNSPCS